MCSVNVDIASVLCVSFRHGKYEYVKGTTSIVAEQVKLVDEVDSEMGTLTPTPMQYEVIEVDRSSRWSASQHHLQGVALKIIP